LITIELKNEHEEKISKIPLSRIAEPREIARGVLYFADRSSSSFIIGQALYIDGGYTAGQIYSTYKNPVIM
jgi:NAD(P)-dependent dehydrogenase (short-subunit alcohol dehydrogenase family)